MSVFEETLDWIQSQAPHEKEYHQAVSSVCKDIVPVVNANEDYKRANVLRRILLPDQIHTFKVEWEDDTGCCRVNQGWRVQQTNVLGPYKGGTRFTPRVNLSVLKFLAFEQSFKNALTGLSLGAGKGGADFDIKNASDSEIRRFSNAYMEKLHNHIGARRDVPAGDINVGSRELGWMYGKYLRLTQSYEGALSGKPTSISGSEMREQATGFGVIHFLIEALAHQSLNIENQSIVISGAGNVALHAALKAIQKGARVISLSNSKGLYVDNSGISDADIHWLLANKSEHDNALEQLSKKTQADFQQGETPWNLKCDIAIPCATQNEINEKAAISLCKHGTSYVIEGANMPCTSKAIDIFRDNNMRHIPGKAANAGGVILSAFEMQQNADFTYRQYDKLEKQLANAMQSIHKRCVDESQRSNETHIDYERSATVAGFRILADALVASGY
uniref:NADP-specific glutamate dehydrogenase n=1 Tax=Ningiella ruwaisensis TaxID=2364274 RepID=UPI00109F6007|nr:NADP-specific glutamate dehydrogenase [Ningiella ruwaisensis]